MSKVVNLFEKRTEKLTPEQRLKQYCIQQIMGNENTAAILTKMTIDEAFAFIADKAAEWGCYENNSGGM